MQNNFSKCREWVPRGTSQHKWRWLTTLLLILTLGIGQMWGDEIFGFTVTSSTTAKGSYSATGGTAECSGAAMSTGGSNEITVGTQTFYKFSSSSQWTFTLSSGKFAAGDVISFTGACTTSNKTGKGFAIQTSPVIAVTGDFPANKSNVVSYTVVADDGIAGQSSFSIKRNDSDIKFGTVSVTRSSGGGEDPVCPSGLTISSKNDKTAFLEGDAIELTAALTAGNGAITYQWYKGGTAEGNKLTGKTAAKLEIASCVEGDAGDYYCVASKSDCSDAVNADAFTITVAHNPCATHHWFVATADATANGKTNWDGFTNAVTGSKGQSNSVTIDGTTYTLTKRTGSTGGGGTILGFTIPANKAGTLYGYMKSSGSAARTLSLKKGDDVVKTNTEIVDGAWTLISIDAIAPGTYTLSPDQNVQVQMFVLKICDATFHTITLDLDGGTGATSIQALDGAPATKPADPTKEHCAFAGWVVESTSAAYDWTENVTGDLTLKATWTQLYTISFDAGEGSGDAPAAIADKATGETFEVPANTFTAPASKEFDKWNDGTNDYAPGATYTVGTANVVLTALWKAASAKYTVHYMDEDGTTPLGDDELVEVGEHPAGISVTKPLYTFASWQLSGSDIALSAVSAAANEEVTLTARWAKAYASSYDMEAYAASDGASKAGIEAALTAAGYAYTNVNGIDYGHTHNYIYDGMKYKTNDGDLSFNVNAGKLVIVKTGNLPANALTMYINGVADPTVFVGANEAVETHVNNYFYSATEALYRLDIQASKGTCAIKAITITDPYTVSFNANGGEDVASLNGTPSVTLPSATKGTDSFLGWFDAAEGGNLIGEAGDSYTPTATVELFAHWEAVSTDARLASISFSSDAGTLSPAFDPEVTSYTYTMPYGTAAIPTITGATSVNANAQEPEIVSQAAAWNETAVIRGVAQSGDKKTYNVTMKIEPKDGISIIKVATTGGTNKTVTGLYAGDGDVNLSSSTKMDNGKYIGFTLDGTTLQAGDRINVHTSQAANTSGSHIIFYDNMTDKNELYDTEEIGGTGDNIFTINAAMVGATTAYVYRANNDAAHQWNGYVDYIEVTRAMNPVLTAITIDTRDGVIDPLDDKHFSVIIPYESDLAALTVVPTIVRNAAHPTTPEAVVSNAGAWIIGDNTYRVMDKDGDYTDYTITLDRDVLKHTVSFNTHGGTSIDPVEVEDGDYLAAAPADPTKDENVFKHWAETEDGEAVDVTSFAITADKEFHAVWEAEPAGIKLFTDLGLNTTNFISAAKAEDSVVISEVKYPCLVNFASNRSSLAGAKQGDLVMYSATTDAAKIKFDLYNANGSAKTAYVWLVEEGDDAATQLDAIEIAGETRVKTAYYEFNGTKNRTVYLTSGSKADIKVLQAKVIESGNAIKQFGQAGYSLNLNHGRFAAATTAPVQFEGATITVSSEHAVLNSSNLATKAANSFNVTSPVIMHVERSGGKYYVYQDPADKGTLYSANADIELNATGTWYFSSENSGSAASFTLIRFDLPKCEKPTVADLANVDYCQGSAIDELTVVATVSDGGTKLYQWYKDGVKIDGAEAATYQSTADGEYYVVVVNTLADHQNSDPTQSNTITVTGHAGTVISGTTGAEDWPGADVTISVTASGKNLSYVWYTCDDALGTNPVAVDPAVNAAELDVTVGAADSYYKVIVSGDCGDAQEAIITVVARQTVDLQDVTGNMTWDFSKANDGSAAGSDLCDDEVLANVAGIVNNSDFKSDNIKATANKFKSGKLQASMIKFHTTVDGMITVVFSNTGGKDTERYLTVNGRKTDKGSKTETAVTYTGFVYAGDVELGVVEGDGNMLNFTSVDFKATTDGTRSVDPSYLGTLCWTNNAVLGGATLYEFAGKDGNNKLVFDEVAENRLEAGKPYIFMPENGNTEIKLYNTDAEAALTEDQEPVNHMYGTIVGKTLVPGVDDNMYYFSSNHIWAVKDFVVNIEVPAYRCYINYPAVLADAPAPAPAPGRRRVTMGVNGQNTATGMENLNYSDKPVKLLINGQIFILRGEKLFDATGRLVK